MLAAAASSAAPALAASVSFSGNLGDPANAALVASDLSVALFTDDLARANNVALLTLNVSVGGSVSFASTGYAGGGIDPYFSIFSGTNRATASFIESNYLHALAVGGDFTLAQVLAPGAYTLAIGVFENLSFAENLGVGVLADGFIGLGGPVFYGDGAYVLTVTLPDAASLPEPAGLLLALTAAAAALWPSKQRRQAPPVSNQG